MQTLSVQQPAAQMLVRGEKTVENRSRPLLRPDKWQFPLWILIHASAKRMTAPVCRDHDMQQTIEAEQRSDPAAFPTGCIVGAVRLTGIVDSVDPSNVWAFGPSHHMVDAAVTFPQPVPFKGRLGLYYVDPSTPGLLGHENLGAIAAAVGGGPMSVVQRFQRVPKQEVP